MKLTLRLGLLSGLNLCLTMLVQWYTVTTLGAGLQTDALFAGMAVPQLVLAVVTGSLAHVLVPLLATEDEITFSRDAWGFFVIILALFSTIALILAVTAGIWVPWLVPGFARAGQALTVNLTRIQLVGLVLTALQSVLWAACHARQRFIWAEASQLLTSLAGVLALFWALPQVGVAAAAWITVLRGGLQVLLLLPTLGPWRTPAWNSPTMLETWRRIVPLLVGTTYYKTDVLLDRALASMAPPGGLSILYLGQQFYGAGSQVISKTLSAPLVPILARLAKSGDRLEFRQRYQRGLAAIVLTTIAGYISLILAGEPMLRLLIGHGGVTQGNVHLLWWLLILSGGMWVIGPIGQLMTNAFYSLGDTRTPTNVGAVAYTIGIAAKIGMYAWLGLKGLALGISANYVIALVLMWPRLQRELNIVHAEQVVSQA